jgi:hypothetical protein
MGLQVLADGVDNNDDLAVLWQLGFDGAGGVTTPSVAGAASGTT